MPSTSSSNKMIKSGKIKSLGFWRIICGEMIQFSVGCFIVSESVLFKSWLLALGTFLIKVPKLHHARNSPERHCDLDALLPLLSVQNSVATFIFFPRFLTT